MATQDSAVTCGGTPIGGELTLAAVCEGTAGGGAGDGLVGEAGEVGAGAESPDVFRRVDRVGFGDRSCAVVSVADGEAGVGGSVDLTVAATLDAGSGARAPGRTPADQDEAPTTSRTTAHATATRRRRALRR